MAKLDYYINLVLNGNKAKTELQGVDSKLKGTRRQGEKPINVNVSAQQALANIRDLNVAFQGVATAVKNAVGTYSNLVNFSLTQVKAETKVRQAVEQTGAAAGFTAEELFKMASELQNVTTYGDEEILSKLTAQFLTFTNLTGDQFKRAAETAMDLATMLESDLQGAAIQLAKALNDPTVGLTALSRSGVTFTEVEKDLIKSLWEAGEKAKAQDVILDALAGQYGGQARAAAAATGQLKQLSNQYGDIKEEIGKLLNESLKPLYATLKELFDWFQAADQSTKEWTAAIALAAPAVGALTVAIGSLVAAWAALGAEMAIATGGLTLLAGALTTVMLKTSMIEPTMREYREELERQEEAAKRLAGGLYKWGEATKQMSNDQLSRVLSRLTHNFNQAADQLEILGDEEEDEKKRLAELKIYYQEHINLLKKELNQRKANQELVKKQLEEAKSFWQEIDTLNKLATQSDLERLQSERDILARQFKEAEGHGADRLALYKQLLAKENELEQFKQKLLNERQAMHLDYAIKTAETDEQQLALEIDRDRQAAVVKALQAQASAQQIAQIHAWYDEQETTRQAELAETRRRNAIELARLEVELGQGSKQELIAAWDTLLSFLKNTYGPQSMQYLSALQQQQAAVAKDGVDRFTEAEISKQDVLQAGQRAFTSGWTTMWNSALAIQSKSSSALVKGVTAMVNSLISEFGRLTARLMVGNAFKLLLGGPFAMFGFKDGGLVPAYADGGLIEGPGGPRDDAIPAMVSSGEYIVNAKATRQYLPLLQAINSNWQNMIQGSITARQNIASLPRINYASGGLVGGNNIEYLLRRLVAENIQMREEIRNLNPSVKVNVQNRSKIDIAKETRDAEDHYKRVFR